MEMTLTAEGPAVDSRNPAAAGKPWSRKVMALLSLTGLVTPFVCFAAAPAAFALSDQDDGLLLAGIGGAHLLFSWAIFGTLI